MRILTSLDALPADFGPSVVTIGNFDGVHLGHRAVFQCLVEKARQYGVSSVVLTFYPHPLKVLAPDKAPSLINTRDEKRRLIEASNIDYLIEIPFDQKFASMNAGDFVDQVLVKSLRVKDVVIGYDYAFGKGREGTVEFLKQCGGSLGFWVDVIEPVRSDKQVYSSTAIRNLVSAGDVSTAANLLGRHYNLEGIVVHGYQRGRKLGFPTANLSSEKELLPAPGVYAAKVKYLDEFFNAVVNLGFRPTFGKCDYAIEVHLLNFDKSIYGESMRVYFYERIRPELSFDSTNDLVSEIFTDIRKAEALLKSQHVLHFD